MEPHELGRVAVLGAATPIGAAVVETLCQLPQVEQLLAIDVDGVPLAPPPVVIRRMDCRDRLLPLALDDVDTLVHCAFSDDLTASPDALFGRNVGGTRNVLEAASKVGVRRLVVLSSATVYGAHPDNGLPLREGDPARANPGFAYAYQRQLVEELVDTWATDHPGARAAVLRTAFVLGGGVDHVISRWLLGPRLLVPAGSSVPRQFVHVDDVGTAVRAVLLGGGEGVFNVACDGWLGTDEIASILDRRILEVPRATMAAALQAGRRVGGPLPPPESLAFLEHPCVMGIERLHELGWRAEHTNRTVLAEFAAAHRGEVALGPVLTTSTAIWRGAALGAAVTTLGAWALTRLFAKLWQARR